MPNLGQRGCTDGPLLSLLGAVCFHTPQGCQAGGVGDSVNGRSRRDGICVGGGFTSWLQLSLMVLDGGPFGSESVNSTSSGLFVRTCAMQPSGQPPAVPRGGQVPVPRVGDPTAVREWVCVPVGDVSPWDSLVGWRDYQAPGKFSLHPSTPSLD